MKHHSHVQNGLSLIAVILVVAVLGMGAAIYLNERGKSAEREARQKEIAVQRAEEAAQNQRAEVERSALEKQAAQAAKPADPLAASLKAADDLYLRWQDAREVATSSSRMALSGPLATLQAVRRDAKELTVPPCLDRGKEELLAGMDLTIEGVLVFMQNPAKMGDLLAQEKFLDAGKRFQNYRADRSMCPSPNEPRA